MARSNAAWGIDIGQCALKALRCRPGDESGRLVADAFDYIEYPKILSQPEADPAQLVKEALEQFLSRNNVRGDRVAISVPGQSGLARFIKLPPVEAKKIPDIVRYEARQQIPFALEDVVWDYQRMAGGSVEEGFALETEVGLFAMKREQVQRALKPLDDAGIEVDFVQLTPLALYNFAAFDQLPESPSVEDYDPDNPPPSLVMVSLGTDTTDLVVTNGFRVWQRSIPIGGNHFTKALTKELKLTFAKAEHLKRNAAAAEDPKAVFQAMRPEFNNLLTEVQRSLGYFTNLDRNAKIGRVIGLGNAMKLPGLQSYLSKNLGQEIARVDAFRVLSGAGVVDAPAFKENLLSFPVCYGLAAQALKQGRISTNLLPREIMQDRMIRDKQPWAVATAACLLLGLTISCLGYWRAWSTADLSKFQQGISEAQNVAQQSGQLVSSFKAAESEFDSTLQLGERLTQAGKNRTKWLELWKALHDALPHDADGQEPPADLSQRNELHITSVRCQKVDNLGDWYENVRQWYRVIEIEKPPAEGVAATDEAAAEGQPPGNAEEAGPKKPGRRTEMRPRMGGPGGRGKGPREVDVGPDVPGPTGAGWVIEITGFHFHNKEPRNDGALFVENTFFKSLVKNAAAAKAQATPAEGAAPAGDAPAADGEAGQQPGQANPAASLPVAAQLGFPIVIDPKQIDTKFILEREGSDANAPKTPLPRFDFVINLCWQDDSAASTGGGRRGARAKRPGGG
ncbi:MAG: type IV pilus assembly protein PilM [Pirellulales bacterium]|nr:type IV pilus assembly protein PilM [Pirellulales bacterium]